MLCQSEESHTCRYQNHALLVRGKQQAECLKVQLSVPAPTFSVFVNSISQLWIGYSYSFDFCTELKANLVYMYSPV